MSEIGVPAEPNWCLFEALTSQQTYLQIVTLFLVVLIWIVLWMSLKKHREYDTFSMKEIRMIHYMIARWSIGKYVLMKHSSVKY